MAEQGRSLPLHVQKEFDEYLKSGRLELGYDPASQFQPLALAVAVMDPTPLYGTGSVL